jgi:hypothetical protein
MHDTNHKGNVAEMVIATEAMKLGVHVMKPLAEHTRYDLIFDLGGTLLRVQCKWAPLDGDVVTVRLVSSRYTSGGRQIRTAYSSDDIDAVAVYCEELSQCYLIPVELFDRMRRGLSLRVAPTKNGQIASINWAQQFLLEATLPFSPTSKSSAPTTSAIASAGTWSVPPPARSSSSLGAASRTSVSFPHVTSLS